MINSPHSTCCLLLQGALARKTGVLKEQGWSTDIEHHLIFCFLFFDGLLHAIALSHWRSIPPELQFWSHWHYIGTHMIYQISFAEEVEDLACRQKDSQAFFSSFFFCVRNKRQNFFTLMLCRQDTQFELMETHIFCYQFSILASIPVCVPNSIQFSMDLRSFQILRPFVEILYFQDFSLFIYLFI